MVHEKCVFIVAIAILAKFVLGSDIGTQNDTSFETARNIAVRTLAERLNRLIICKRTDPQLNDCIKLAIGNMIEFLREDHTAPNIGLGSHEPYRLPTDLFYNINENGINGRLQFRNAWFRNLTNIKVEEVNLNSNLTGIKVKLFVDKLRLVSDYHFKGEIFSRPVELQGYFHSIINDLGFLYVGSLEDDKQIGKLAYYIGDVNGNFRSRNNTGNDFHYENKKLREVIGDLFRNNRSDFGRNLLTIFSLVHKKFMEYYFT